MITSDTKDVVASQRLSCIITREPTDAIEALAELWRRSGEDREPAGFRGAGGERHVQGAAHPVTDCFPEKTGDCTVASHNGCTGRKARHLAPLPHPYGRSCLGGAPGVEADTCGPQSFTTPIPGGIRPEHNTTTAAGG